MPLRIAYFINQYPKVSHSFVRREILALERQGVQVQRIALRGWDAELVDDTDLAERTRTQFVLQRGAAGLLPAVLKVVLKSPRAALAALALAFRLSRRAERPWPYHLIYLAEACQTLLWLRASGATHLHAHFGTNSAEVAMLVRCLGGPPYSFTVHGPDEFDRPEMLHLAEKVHASAFVVAVSSFGRSQLYRWIGHAHWPKVQVVHCGIEPAFHEVASCAAPDAPRLVCIGRLSAQKGQLLLIEAVARVAAKVPGIQLVLAGDGEMRREIEGRIAELGLQRNVHITGWVDAARVREEILAARAMVLASFAEGLPVVIMEAMALRRPVITTTIAGIPELVRAGENGWLFPAGDIDELVAAIEACLMAPAAQLAQMGEAARTRALARHDADVEAGKLLRLFAAPAAVGT